MPKIQFYNNKKIRKKITFSENELEHFKKKQYIQSQRKRALYMR